MLDAQTVALVTGLVQALAWPVTVLVVVFLLRSPISELLLRLRSLEHGDTRLNFQEELHAISKQAEVAATPSAAGVQDDALDALRALAKTAPRQTVLNAWNPLLDAAIELARGQRMQLTDLEIKTPKFLAQRLKSAGLIDAQTCDAFVSMRLLRNKVAHAEAMPVTTKDALAFVDMVASLIQTLACAKPPEAP